MTETDSLSSSLRREALEAPISGIVDVFNYGRHREGLIPLWVGEGDLPTPSFISDAAVASLAAGETFYTYQRGLPELREAIARYIGRLYGRTVSPERFFVTSGGMHALQVAFRMVSGAGDEVIVPTPAWPNFVAGVGISGARPVEVPMTYTDEGWLLDVDRIAAAITPSTKAIVINSPSNPTSWMATPEDIAAVLSLARRHGLWIIADEIYGRFVYDGPAPAPSFHDVIDDEDRVIFVQTMSKNWAMTGWRVGWLEANPRLGQTIENLIQYSSSGTAAFMQRAAVAALDQGEAFVAEQFERARIGRTIVSQGLAATNRVRFAPAQGAFYLFFSVDGVTDSARFARVLVDEAAVGLAPGTTFGAGGEAFFRLCFARKVSDLEEATRRLASALMRLAP
ncbi:MULTISPECIES: pyridoxal phosphate-dependent aminotransferase [unclassified Chelatococcus]|uniref:pyridoxal phosphate-dependent aminotransferase n=1 Tax=unclassified Chelatococcus TaxID=2638111 RepID=UPI001BCCA6F8|nr:MULTISPECIES: pyridoxal phosphate-dependent aminotransferase [unclassified Chelatococcus]MBS7696324.1 pyridoxal phosphate-dependent aminotransferase [Chelatococcus sp. YT9]MBX3556934.1 pyridoxal phosphate-dependent aminotransferase [Chelatococcus sp.]